MTWRIGVYGVTLDDRRSAPVLMAHCRISFPGQNSASVTALGSHNAASEASAQRSRCRSSLMH